MLTRDQRRSTTFKIWKKNSNTARQAALRAVAAARSRGDIRTARCDARAYCKRQSKADFRGADASLEGEYLALRRGVGKSGGVDYCARGG